MEKAKVFRNEKLFDFIVYSYECLKNSEYADLYYHVLTPNDEKPIVVHNETQQITIVLEGNGIAIVNGQSYCVTKGDIILIPSKNTHQFVAMSDLRLFHLHIPFETENTDREIVKGKDFTLHQ